MQLLFPNPLLTTTTAHLISLAFGTIYVGSIYLSPTGRPSYVTQRTVGTGKDQKVIKQRFWRDRDDPDVIRARLAAVSAAMLACCLTVFGVIWWHVGLKNFDIALEATILRLGILPPSLSSFSSLFSLGTYSAHLITPVLFLGSLFGSFLGKQLPGQRNWLWNTHVVARFFTIHGARNYWVAPLTEEVVFRACVLSIYHLAGASKKGMIFLAPFTFGVAHLHHAWETYIRYGRNASAAQRAILSSLFQLTYTTLFGMHASYLFLRTGSLWPSVTAHIFCNVMGIPEIVYEWSRYKWARWAIANAYLTGIAGFIYTLERWSRTDGNLYWPLPGNDQFTYGKY